MTVKFDRVTGTFFITTLDETETFTGTGGRYKFTLKWPVDLRTNKIKITIGDDEILSRDYTITNVNDSNGRTHDRKIGQIVFNTPPANNKTITIEYFKDISLLTAADRINLFYNPTTGQLANDLGQLLDGIDYGGVQVKSFNFGGGSGWSADSWFTSAYDTYDNTYEDEVFRLSDDSTKIYDFAKALETGIEYNVYKNGIRIDDPNFGTGNPVTNPNAIIQSITGASQTGFILTDDGTIVGSTVIKFDEEILPTQSGDVIVIRKNTSDGSFIPDPRAYDTLITGGDLAYATASGINPEDIVIDGDGFVTPTTSKGPEELIPGQVLDTLDIKVYDRVGEGGSRIESVAYVGDNVTKIFNYDGQPQSKFAIFVKVNNIVRTDYTVDYKNKTITFTSAPAINSSVNIITMSGNGEEILDLDTFTGDGSTIQFLTRVDWKDELNSLITVNGEKVDYILETTDSSYDTANKVAITFGQAPAEGAVINYGIYASNAQTFSEIKTDNIRSDGSTSTYELSVTPFSSLPSSHNMIVRVSGSGSADAEYNNGAISNVTGDGSDFFKREVTTNGVRIMGAGTVGGQTAVPDAWLEKVARMFELFTDPTGAGINQSYQRALIKTLRGDAGTYHAGLPTIQRVARGAGADYTPNFLTDQGVIDWNLTPLFDTHVQNDMVWYLNSTGSGYGDGDQDAQEVIEHVFHTLHMHGLPADDIKLYEFLAADWQSGDLYAAMEEAYDAGKWDPSGYQANPDDWKTIADAFEVAAKEYLYLLNFCMFEYTDLWDGNSLAPEWSDDMRTQAGILANNPLGYAFHNTYIAPVISKPSLATIRSIFQDGNTPAQDNPALAGASGYVVDALVGGSPAVPAGEDNSLVTNPDAIMPTFIGDGSTNIITIPIPDEGIYINDGDVLIFRPIDSDGSIDIQSANYLDAEVSGGTLLGTTPYSTATGITPEEIVIDGEKFISPDQVPAPEENVPGQVLENLSIRVFHTDRFGAPAVLSRIYTGDNTTVVFGIDQHILENASLLVYVNKQLQVDQVDYTIDYENNQIRFINPPGSSQIIELFSIGVGGVELLDVREFTGDGQTRYFLTGATFSSTGRVFATLNGVPTKVGFVNSNGVVNETNNTLVEFGIAPRQDDLIQIVVLSEESGQTESIVRINQERINLTPGTYEYPISFFDQLGTNDTSNVIVEYNGLLLRSVDSTYKIYDGSNVIPLNNDPALSSGTIIPTQIKVYVNGEELQGAVDYNFNGASNEIELLKSINNGDIVIIENFYNSNYEIKDGNVKFSPIYPINNNDYIDIIWFTKYTEVNILKDVYRGNQNSYKLQRPVRDISNVWTYLNGVRLTPGIDFYVGGANNAVYIKQATVESDVIETITYSNKIYTSPISYEIYRDVLNQNRYNRYQIIDVTLSEDLHYYDTVIKLSDASKLPTPGIGQPGIVTINGEKIEYLKNYAKRVQWSINSSYNIGDIIENNGVIYVVNGTASSNNFDSIKNNLLEIGSVIEYGNSLGNIRRGLYGTSIRTVHESGTQVIDTGFIEELPYKDEQEKTDFVSDGSSLIIGPLDFTPVKGSEFNYTDSIPEGYGRCDNIEVFVGGRRLQKDSFKMYDATVAAYSPDGDIQYEAEFSVDGINEYIRLTKPVEPGTRITVIRRVGKTWYDRGDTTVSNGASLSDATTAVARFLQNSSTELPE
jgi:hypothetical protein